jgi:hypothetical protein
MRSPRCPCGVFGGGLNPLHAAGRSSPSRRRLRLAALFRASASYVVGVLMPVDGGPSAGFSEMGAEEPGAPDLDANP